MAACADIELEIDEVSKTGSNNSSYRNATHSENNQNDLPTKSLSRLDSSWGKRKALPCSFEKVLPSTQTSNITITDECAVPSIVNSTHQHIQRYISLESPMVSGTMQCNLYKNVVKSTRGLKIHQRSYKSLMIKTNC